MKRLMAMVMVAGLLMLGGTGLAVAPAAQVHTAETRAGEPGATQTHAEGHGEGDVVSQELKLGPFIVTVAIFICLFLVLSKTAWKPIMTGLKNRENSIRESIEAAKKAKEEAERSGRELEAKMAEVQRQAALQLTQAKADAQKLADTIRTQAEAESAALKDRTLREIDAAKQQALGEINSHAAELGTSIARKILQRNVTVDDQQRLVDESLSAMARKN